MHGDFAVAVRSELRRGRLGPRISMNLGVH